MKKTKRSLITSLVTLLLCSAMFVGSTFAWFTDTVSNTGNRIQAGTLKVDLLMNKKVNDAYEGYKSIAGGQGDIFKEDTVAQDSNVTLWEPGKTQIVYLAVKNKGNLALKYNIYLDVTDEGLIVGKDSKKTSLEYAIIPGASTANPVEETNWTDLKEAAKTLDPSNAGDITFEDVSHTKERIVTAPNGKILASEEESVNTQYFALAVHMKEDAGNEYQGKDAIIDVLVVAGQQSYEEDGFGNNDYDDEASFDEIWDGTTPDTKPESVVYDIENRKIYVKDAPGFAYLNKVDDGGIPVVRNEVNQLLQVAGIPNWESEKMEVVIEKDIDFQNKSWTPMKLAFCINGNGKTIKNIVINGSYLYAGLFTKTLNNNTGAGYVKDLTLDTITVTNSLEDSATGTISGYANYPIENCVVKNAIVNGGKYVGGIAGQSYSSIKNCVVENVKIDGKYKVGGLTGQINTEGGTTYVKENVINNTSITCNSPMEGKSPVVGKLIGYKNEAGGTISVSDNTYTNVTGPEKDIGNQ